MLVLFVLLISWATLRLVGFVGVETFDSWKDSARSALAIMLLFTASAHFTSMKDDLLRMMPSWVPAPRAMVFFTGLCEIAGRRIDAVSIHARSGSRAGCVLPGGPSR